MESKDLSQVELLVEIVGEKINAQVAAHEKYSQAFIKILDTLDTIIEQQDEITDGDTAFFKKLLIDIESLSKDIKENDDAQKKWRDSMFSKLDTYKISNENKIENLQKTIEKSITSAENTMKMLNEKISQIIDKVESINASNEEKHTIMGDQLNLLLESRKKLSKHFEKVLIYFAAIISIIGIIMGLMQLNLLSIQWGPK